MANEPVSVAVVVWVSTHVTAHEVTPLHGTTHQCNSYSHLRPLKVYVLLKYLRHCMAPIRSW